jgi:PAS domain S-box-containing protein
MRWRWHMCDDIKENTFEDNEERHKNLVQVLPELVFIHDDKRIFYCNQSAANMTGVQDTKELLDTSILEMVPSKMQYSFRNFIMKSLEEDIEPTYFQTKFMDKNGEIKYVEIITTKYNFQGYPALLSVVRDITHVRKINDLEKDIEQSKRLLDDALEYDKMKTEYFATISHELRTPLNVILAAIQLLKLESDQENKYMKMMQQNCFRLLRLVNNIIDMTRIEANYFDIKVQSFDIIKLIKSTTLSVSEYTNKKGVNLFFNTNVEEKMILCDPDQMERIILNLLSNSIKFTQRGGNIWVSVYDYGKKINIIVKDDGIGIPQDKQEYIFNRFHQVDKSFTRKHEGSGLGLFLVKALVEKHKGEIIVRSELGKGSEFIIEIPCDTFLETENIPYFPNEYSNYYYNGEKIPIELSDIY